MVKPHWLELIYEQIKKAPSTTASICSSWDNLQIDGSIDPGEDNPAREIETIAGTEASVKSTLVRGCWWHLSGAALHLPTWEQIGSFDPQYSHNSDYDWLLRVLDYGYSILYIPRTLLVYRQHVMSVSSYSFRHDLDLLQGSAIRRKYKHILSRTEYWQIQWSSITSALYRAARAISRRDFQKALRSSNTLRKLLYYGLVDSLTLTGLQN